MDGYQESAGRSVRRVWLLGCASSLIAWVAAGPCAAAEPTSNAQDTTLQVTELHCASCAKKLARKLYALKGVAKVRADVKKNVAVTSPQTGKRLEPVEVWQAAVAAGFKPVKLTGPDGVFEADAEGKMVKTADKPSDTARR